MTASTDLERRLAEWLEGQAPTREPERLIEAVTTRLAHTGRLPGWALPERWIPAPLTLRLAVVPRAMLVLLALALLVSLALGGALVTGALPSEGPSLSALPRNGLIAYTVGGDIWLVDERGEQRQRLTSGPDEDVVGAWSPDGTWLAYWAIHSNDYPGSDMSLSVIRIGDPEPRVLASDLAWPGMYRDCGTHVSWSPDSTAIAYAHANGLIEIAPVDGGPIRTLVQGSPMVDGGRSPSWSPDGSTVAYQGFRAWTDGEGGEGSDGRLFVMPAAGGTSMPLVDATSLAGPGDCGFHESQWSPDGSRIAAHVRTESGYRVLIARADGTDETELPDDGDEWWPRWSPDGSRLVVSRYLDPTSVPVILGPDGSEQVVLDVPHPWGSQILWSPDGTRLLTVMDEWAGLAILDPTGTEPPVLIPSTSGEVWYSAWQPLVP